MLVGLSIGACVARLYAAEYPADVAGMVIVDHAFTPDRPPEIVDDSRPRLLEQTPIELTVEDISHFENLPARSQELHRWAMSLHPKLPSAETLDDCLKELKNAALPVDLPIVVVSTGNESRGYTRLQSELLALSRRSSQMRADLSFHAVEIDQPEVVVAAIRRVVGLTSSSSAR
ncbi:MAG: alpha/beta hydrolase [Ignavibacteriota bacterium]